MLTPSSSGVLKGWTAAAAGSAPKSSLAPEEEEAQLSKKIGRLLDCNKEFELTYREIIQLKKDLDEGKKACDPDNLSALKLLLARGKGQLETLTTTLAELNQNFDRTSLRTIGRQNKAVLKLGLGQLLAQNSEKFTSLEREIVEKFSLKGSSEPVVASSSASSSAGSVPVASPLVSEPRGEKFSARVDCKMMESLEREKQAFLEKGGSPKYSILADSVVQERYPHDPNDPNYSLELVKLNGEWFYVTTQEAFEILKQQMVDGIAGKSGCAPVFIAPT